MQHLYTPDLTKDSSCILRRRLAGVWRQPGGLSREVVTAEFARLNGWRVAAQPFGFESLIRMRRVADDPLPRSRVLDHVTHFEIGTTPIAIVAEPYSHIEPEEIATFAKAVRAYIHEPPATFASAHFPGNARFVVFTCMNEEPTWLPEQRDPFGHFAIHESEIRSAAP